MIQQIDPTNLDEYTFIPSHTLSAKVAQQFYDEVCRRAEQNMQKTGRLEGAHYAAMQSVLKEWKERA